MGESLTQVDEIDLARWGKDMSVLGDELATTLSRSDREIGMLGAGFARKATRDFDEYLMNADVRRRRLISTIEGLGTGLSLASVQYLATDEEAAVAVAQSTSKMLRL